ncbi:MAG: hypothetical protein ABIQ72_13825 [Usitatibacter sp.]
MAELPEPVPILRFRNAQEMMNAAAQTREHYEGHGALLLENAGLDYDAEFIHRLSFPPEWKKFGTVNDLTVPPVVFADGGFKRTQNPLGLMIKEDAMLLKTYSELLRLELGFKLLIMELFPAYRQIHWVNCTFRFTRTENEPLHVDVFNAGRPFAEELKLPRLKFFMNVDSEPRVWNVGPSLKDVLRFSAGALGDSLPADVNQVCDIINKSGILANFPTVRVEIPPRGIVFANGATIVHQVIFGQRMVALEAQMPRWNVAASEWDCIGDWITQAGYRAS